MTKSRVSIIVAGGKGERMQGNIPKQFMAIANRPILMHTLDVFFSFDPTMLLVLVLPMSEINYWDELCKKYTFNIPHKVVAGGNSRFESVKNGLALIEQPSIVAIHDGVRPFVSHQTISKCFVAAEQYQSAIPAVELVDSIRQLTDQGSISTDRSQFRLVQTPQVFDSTLIQKAYQQEFRDSFTDDASVVEALGHKVKLVEGNRENIKITTSMDLLIGEAFVGNRIINV